MWSEGLVWAPGRRPVSEEAMMSGVREETFEQELDNISATIEGRIQRPSHSDSEELAIVQRWRLHSIELGVDKGESVITIISF